MDWAAMVAGLSLAGCAMAFGWLISGKPGPRTNDGTWLRAIFMMLIMILIDILSLVRSEQTTEGGAQMAYIIERSLAPGPHAGKLWAGGVTDLPIGECEVREEHRWIDNRFAASSWSNRRAVDECVERIRKLGVECHRVNL